MTEVPAHLSAERELSKPSLLTSNHQEDCSCGEEVLGDGCGVWAIRRSCLSEHAMTPCRLRLFELCSLLLSNDGPHSGERGLLTSCISYLGQSPRKGP